MSSFLFDKIYYSIKFRAVLLFEYLNKEANMSKGQLVNQENYSAEYKEVAATYRFQISLRFIVNAYCYQSICSS